MVLRVLLIVLIALPLSSYGASKSELDAKVQSTLAALYSRVPGARETVENAVAVLVFPEVAKGGFFVGGEFGEGALLKQGQTLGYYQIASGSLGIQIGVQVRSQVIAFRNEDSFNRFYQGNGWEVGVDGSAAIATEGAGGKFDSKSINQPVVAFVFGNKGLMANMSLEGTRIIPVSKP